MKKNLDLQLFAEEASSAEPKTDTAGKNDNGAAADQSKATGGAKATDEKKYSDADLDQIINKKFAQWQEKKQKEVDEAQKLAEMNATKRAEYERDQLKKELEEYKLKDSLAEMSKTARKMLSDDGITVPDELVAMLVTTDAQKTKAAVDSFKTAYLEAVEAAVKERLRGEVPRVGAGASTPVTEIEKRIKKYQ